MIKSETSHKAIGAVVTCAFLTALAWNAAAADDWKKDHPRRAEVNARLANQNKRVNADVKAGTMTKAQAQTVKKEDRQIRQEERSMASQNGGHITKQEQKTLNQQENAVSRQIPPK
jgi:hypothetical protein